MGTRFIWLYHLSLNLAVGTHSWQLQNNEWVPIIFRSGYPLHFEPDFTSGYPLVKLPRLELQKSYGEDTF